MTNFVCVPKDRVGALVGRDGETKKLIEKTTSSKLTISRDGDVCIESKDPIIELKVVEFIKAVGRGFSPERAKSVLKEQNVLDIIELDGTPKQKLRLRARIIGTRGKTRAHIEQMLNCEISVYEDTVAIICNSDWIGTVREAIELLIRGSNHSTVYKFVEKEALNLNF